MHKVGNYLTLISIFEKLHKYIDLIHKQTQNLIFRFANICIFKIACILFFQIQPLVSDNYIVISPYGRLGNALFQTASAIPFAKEYGYQVLIPNSYKMAYPTIFRNFHSLSEFNEDKLQLVSSVLHFRSIKELIPLVQNNKNIRLDVGSFVFDDFKNHKNLIIETFSPPQIMIKKLQTKYPFLKNSRVVVGIHIRAFYSDIVYALEQGDSLDTICKTFPLPDVNFLKQAIRFFENDALFIICSDHIPAAKTLCSTLPEREYIFIDGNSAEEDLYLLSLCDHLIISPYSFSWWAAYLNTNPNKIVISPDSSLLSYPEEYLILPHSAPPYLPFPL